MGGEPDVFEGEGIHGVGTGPDGGWGGGGGGVGFGFGAGRGGGEWGKGFARRLVGGSHVVDLNEFTHLLNLVEEIRFVFRGIDGGGTSQLFKGQEIFILHESRVGYGVPQV